MYKAVSRWMIRFNPLFFRNLISPRLLAFPCSIRRRNSAGGCFFSRSLQAWLLSTAKFAHLAHQDERRRETLYPENKIENGRGKSYSLASDSGTDSCALYEKWRQWRWLHDISWPYKCWEVEEPVECRWFGMRYPATTNLAPYWILQIVFALENK